MGFIDEMGDLSSMMTEWMPNFGMFMAIVDGIVFMGWFNGAFGNEFPITMGTIMTLIMSLASSAYVAVKTIDASVSMTKGYYNVYGGWSEDGNLIGAWELGFVILWLLWSLVVTLLAYVTAADVIDYTMERAKAVYEDGTLGTVATPVDAMKIFTLMMVLGFGTWLSAHTLGDSANELLSWFDQYDSKTRSEGTDTDTGLDTAGTAIGFDLIYHSITALYSYGVLSAFIIGAYVFAFNFLGFGRAPADCDPANLDGVDYSYALTAIPNLGDGDYEECIEAMDKIFDIVDINKDSYIDKCEDAKFLKAYGNTDEYALEYPGMATRDDLHKICMWAVPDGFDQMHGNSMDMMSTIMNMWPFSMIRDMMAMMIKGNMKDMHDEHHEMMDMMEHDHDGNTTEGH